MELLVTHQSIVLTTVLGADFVVFPSLLFVNEVTLAFSSVPAVFSECFLVPRWSRSRSENG